MNRDLDLVRRILMDVADSGEPVDASAWVTDTVSRDLAGFHVLIMREAGLIDATIMAADNNPYYVCRVNRLTWEGADYLASVRSNKVWSEVKKRLATVGGDAALAVVKAAAVAVLSQVLG